MQSTAQLFLFSLLFLIVNTLQAQEKTNIQISLDQTIEGQIRITAYPPADKNEWQYVIPEIIPGTYMKVNYERFYKDFKAVDSQGQKMKIRKKGNILSISGSEPLKELSFSVKQSFNGGKIWDNTLTCAGTIFTDQSYLLNFQLVSGYFDGYQSNTHRIEIQKAADLYGATSMKALSRSADVDVFETPSYASLIDQPILYGVADTTSFMIDGHRFRIAIHSERGRVKATDLKPRVELIMHAIDSFSGFQRDEDYHLLFYFVNRTRIRGLVKGFGLGSALEHNYTSVYYYAEPWEEKQFYHLDNIVPHEYLHTIAPLSLHSEKIHNFNFETPDMSRHGWMYEGMTDYFANLLSAQYNLSASFSRSMAWSAHTAEKRKPRSFTESSQHIIRKNRINWISKMLQLVNFYDRGKLVAMAMDMEIYNHTNGEKRLLDIAIEINNDLDGTYFNDDDFENLLVSYTFPEMRELYTRYVVGDELVPYEKYFERLGWIYHPKGSKLPGYGSFNIRFNQETQFYYINWQKKNEFKLKEGDIVKAIEGQSIGDTTQIPTELYKRLFYPKLGDEMTLAIERKGKSMELKAVATSHKLKYPRILLKEDQTPEEKDFVDRFYNKSRQGVKPSLKTQRLILNSENQ